jgi:aryl-alcohol dehydrogenase-like predicted oxidoreductase
MPLQFGLLTGKFSSQTRFAGDDHRSFRLTSGIMQATLNILEENVWPVAEKEEMTQTQLALSFILSFKEISTIIPGIRTPEHVVQNTSGLKTLSEGNKKFLQSLSQSHWKHVVEMMEKQG